MVKVAPGWDAGAKITRGGQSTLPIPAPQRFWDAALTPIPPKPLMIRAQSYTRCRIRSLVMILVVFGLYLMEGGDPLGSLGTS